MINYPIVSINEKSAAAKFRDNCFDNMDLLNAWISP